MSKYQSFDVLQNSFGRIEESGRLLCKLSLYFPVMNSEILEELKESKRRIERLIAAFEFLEKNAENEMIL